MKAKIYFILGIMFFLLGTLFFIDTENKNPLCKNKPTVAFIGGKTLNLEVACSISELKLGLMNRKKLNVNSGMIFVFNEEQQLKFWMKDTLIPLDIAYINKDFIITQIEHMKPLDTTPIESKENVLYALEVNKNWFLTNGVKPGDKISFH